MAMRLPGASESLIPLFIPTLERHPPMDLQLKGKRALVAGGSKGIGKAVGGGAPRALHP
jgi:hypothetical protein